jgi:hypothetical protein
MKRLIFILLNLPFIYIIGQNQFSIVRGKVVNIQTGIFVGNVEIYASSIQKTFACDENGGFIFAHTPGKHFLQFSHEDYELKLMEIDLYKDTNIVVAMVPLLRSYAIEEVAIERKHVYKNEDNYVGLERLNVQTIQNIPALAGEKDLIKTMAMYPGIQNASEGSADLMVRGGTPDQNLYLFDNMTLYNPNRLMGFISVYNPDAISKAEIFKAGFPPRYGGRLSSVVDVEMKEADLHITNAELGLGLLAANGNIQVPVIKGKSSLLLCARKSYFDYLIKGQRQQTDFGSINFQDVTSKYSHLLPKGKIQVEVLTGNDNFYTIDAPLKTKDFEEDKYATGKKDLAAGVSFDYRINEKVINNFHASYSGLTNTIDEIRLRQDSTGYQKSFESSIMDWSVGNKISFYPSENEEMYAGFECKRLIFNPAQLKHKDIYIDTSNYNIETSTLHAADLFIGYNFQPGIRWDISIGARLSNLISDKRMFTHLEPRATVKYITNSVSSVKLTFSRMSQSLHFLTNPGLGIPMDIWVPSNNYLKPETSNQISMGFYHKLKQKDHFLDVSIETYVKNMSNIISYRDGYSSHNFGDVYQAAPKTFEEIITIGKGWSCGAEWLMQKQYGSFTGWLGYSLSWTKNQFDDLNKGKPFFAWNDRRHNVSLVSNYKLNAKYSFNLSWMFSTGRPITLPIFAYQAVKFNYSDGSIYEDHETISMVMYGNDKRNAHRMKDIHRLDIGIQRHFNLKKSSIVLELGVYNVYNRSNPIYYSVDYGFEWDESLENREIIGYKRSVTSVSVFPVLPYFNLKWKM